MLLQSSPLASEEPPPFELKGSLFTLTVLYLFKLDRVAIERHLTEKIKQAPGFFNNTPVVIDLEGLHESRDGVDFIALYELLKGCGMVPVGIRNGNPKLQAVARLAGLPLLPERRSASPVRKPEQRVAEPVSTRGLIVSHPVRSGQQIYAPNGDLIILGTVSAGAEIMADGHVHVYGLLRGRAQAGMKGDLEARIFCQGLEAELISIAGRYRVSEQIGSDDWGKAAQIHLADDRLIIDHLAR
ncbi:MAG TPA: septum site-determining protein MinC [Candidatus Competibacter phosphatis]|nr:septum site-determining protein MinC [Candidatus Competibacter phosphatis]